MVNPHHYHSQEGRRHNRFNAPYPGSYPARRAVAYPVYPEMRHSIVSEDEPSSQRKRIAVACGRCRKRKIRCSGDNGNGSPCTNCRNAGHEPCQYLRVASQETQLKHNSFDYSLETSRQFHVRCSAATPPPPTPPILSTFPHTQSAQTTQAGQPVQPVPQYPEDVPGLVNSHAIVYRHHSPSLTYNTRPFEPAVPWTSGLPVEHNLSYHLYPHVYDHELGIPYRSGGPSSAAGPSRDPSVCPDPEPSYTYGSGHTTTLVHRAAPASGAHHSAGMPFQNTQAPAEASADAPAGVALAASVNDRVLPAPHRGTALSVLTSTSGASSYRNEAPSPVYGHGRQPAASASPQTSNSGTMTGPMTPASEASSSGYTNYEPSSSLPPAVPSYASMTLASQLTRTNDLYGPSSSVTYSSSAASSGDSLRGTGSGTDMTYRYYDTTTAEDGTPTVGPIPKIERRNSTDAGVAMTHPHQQGQHQTHGQGQTQQRQQSQSQHHGQTFVAQNHGQHASYAVPSEADGSESETASADGERKPAVLHA